MKICTVCGEISNNELLVCQQCENQDLRLIITLSINNLDNTFNGRFEGEC